MAKAIYAMALDRHLSGRADKRLPIMMEARLAPADGTRAQRDENAHVENISALGARVSAGSSWQEGKQVEITPATGDGPWRGEVVYCHKQTDGRYIVGVKFLRSLTLLPLLQKLNEMFH